MEALVEVLGVRRLVQGDLAGRTVLMDSLPLGPQLDFSLAASVRALSLRTSLSSHRVHSLQEPVDRESRPRVSRAAAAGAESS